MFICVTNLVNNNFIILLIIDKIKNLCHFIFVIQIRDIIASKTVLYLRACLITLHSNFEIFQKGHPAVENMLDRRIFER